MGWWLQRRPLILEPRPQEVVHSDQLPQASHSGTSTEIIIRSRKKTSITTLFNIYVYKFQISPGHSAIVQFSNSKAFPSHCSLPLTACWLQRRPLTLEPWPQEAVHSDQSPKGNHSGTSTAMILVLCNTVLKSLLLFCVKKVTWAVHHRAVRKLKGVTVTLLISVDGFVTAETSPDLGTLATRGGTLRPVAPG